jgi:hypothetical protein
MVLRDPYHDLFSFGKVVARVAVECHLAQLGNRHKLLGDDLGRVEQIKSESQLVLFVHDLNAELLN